MPWTITRFPILASTNDLALDWMRSGRAKAGDVLVAAQQTAGRGRRGRGWHSAKGALLFTAVLPFQTERAGWCALAAGAAVARAVRELGAPAGVKWPNDVTLQGRKLAGILVETAVPELAAVGVGLNVANPYPHDPELSARMIRLADVLSEATPDQVLDRILPSLEECWSRLFRPDLTPLRRLWADLDTTAGRRLCWTEGAVSGTAAGVDEAGALRIRTDEGRIVRAHVGEVAFLGG